MKLLVLLIFLGATLTLTRAQSVIPERAGGSGFSFTFANIYFEIDSARGARISSFMLDDTEILYVDGSAGDNIGSTFWPSPQSVWGWPPIANLNNKPYAASISGDKIIFKGATDSKYQLRFYKTMYASLADTSITIEYVMKNEKSTTQKWAPWEVSRVLANGLTVFPKGLGAVTGDMKTRTSEENGYVWYDQDNANSPGNKFFCDGKGWLAHVTSDDILFIKKFEDITPTQAAPAESEIEVYTAPADLYTELENQGAYVNIAGKDSVTWKVKWIARKLPSSVDISVGSKSLTEYIEKLVAADAPSAAIKLDRSSEDVKIFPNPASGTIQIDSGKYPSNNLQLNISNLAGKIVLSQDISGGDQKIDIRELDGGLYIYNLESKGVSIANGKFSVLRF
jgi:hypothetical protein